MGKMSKSLTTTPRDYGAMQEYDPRRLLREVHGIRVSLEGIPLLTPSLLVFPAVPIGEACLQDPIEPDPFLRQWPNRPKFSNPAEQTLLEILSTSYHSHYVDAIKSVISGASPMAAFSRFGIVAKLVREYLTRGSKDIAEGFDSYYSRFSLDITRAVGMATESAQMLVYINNPLEFLERGMGQAMGDEYAPRLTNPSEMAIEITQLPAPPLEMSALKNTYTDTSLQSTQQALAILARAGYSPERMLSDHIRQHGNRTDEALQVDADPIPPAARR